MAAGSPPLPPPAGADDGSAGEAAVDIEYRGRQLQAERGTTLRTSLLLAGATPHNGRATLINCRGLGTCGTCAVEIQGPVEPAGWTAAERLRLNFPPHAPPGNRRLRLACQMSAAWPANLRVVKRDGFWGQGDRVLPDLPPAGASAAAGGAAAGDDAAAAAAAVMPLGQLELVLDRLRRLRHE